ncbi:MAG: thiamine pyrophosphate-dependent enzyme [Candidatus Eremiobacterota bacterium]
MNNNIFDMDNTELTWCPGCGNYSILKILKEALAELDIKPEELMMVSGIGQAAKAPHFIKSHVFNGLHGRALPPATAIKAVNPALTVIVESGDGDIYGEGGNHFIHTVRRNPDITTVVHNNMVYGLTKGQASPTSQPGFKTNVQTDGVSAEPFNPVSIAISLDVSFVARAFCGDFQETKEIFKKAIKHKGFSLVDVFQPCVTFNKVNTFKWFKEQTYYLEHDYNPYNRADAFKRSIEKEKLPLGIFYIKNKKTFEENTGLYETGKEPLFKRRFQREKLYDLISSKK